MQKILFTQLTKFPSSASATVVRDSSLGF